MKNYISSKCKMFAGTASLMALAITSAPVFAQDAPSDDTRANTVDEIIVTAQRRKQKIEEVPISITAFSAEDLQKKNIRGIEDYFGKTANVNFAEGVTGRQSTTIGIRGVSNIGGVTNAFTIYIDEFAGVSNNPNIYDVERVEVLRGPQGTYFGRNSTGGAINITTNKPNDTLSGGGEIGYASFKTFTARGFVNVPVSDTLFVRLTGDFERSDGFVKNVNPTGPQPDIRNYTGRFQVRYVPTDKLTVDLQGVYGREKLGLLQSVPTGILDPNAGTNTAILGAAALRASANPLLTPLPDAFLVPLDGRPVDPGNGFYPRNRNSVNVGAPEQNDDRQYTFIGKVAYDFDFATLSSVTGYQNQNRIIRRDTDGIALDIGRNFQDITSSIFTQELRLNSAPSEVLNWTVGAFYAKQQLNLNQTISVGPLIAAALGTDVFQTARFTGNLESYAAFAEISGSPFDRVTATFGVRYTHDKVGESFTIRSLEGFDASQADFIANGLTLGAPFSFATPTVTFQDVSPRFAVSYEFDGGLNAYATVSNGYKTGGNQNNPAAIAAGFEKFKPEEIWNYEVGLKGRLFDNSLQFGLAAFYADWKNLQTSVQVNSVGQLFDITGNAASARNYGVEADFNWATPLKGLRFDGSVGYLNAKFRDYKNANLGNFNNQCRATIGQAPVFIPDPDGGPDPILAATDCDLSGQSLPLASKWTVTLGAEYTIALSDSMDAFIGGDMSYRSPTTPSLTSLALGGAKGVYPYGTQAYTIFNLRAGVNAGKWRIDAYAQNLLNKNYFTQASDSGALDGYRVVPSPRVIGIRAGIDF